MYTIVIADDEKLICDAILSVLGTTVPELSNIQVFHDGTAAYNFISSNKVDILLLDIEMPGKSGLDIAQFIADQKLDSYVIIITAYQNFDYAKRAIDYHVNAFLTKPFSSQQLVDAVRAGINSVQKKSRKTDDKYKTNRSLLQALCYDKTSTFYDDFFLCKNAQPLGKLFCTEVLLTDDNLSTLSKDSLSTMSLTLEETIEKDEEKQSIFLLECKDIVKFLIFSTEEPDLDFIKDAVRIISCYTGTLPNSIYKTYPSFAEYRTCLSFVRETDTFIQQVIDGSYSLAKNSWKKYVYSLSDENLKKYADYLSETCPITIKTPDAESILQSIDSFVSNTFGNQTKNYIVISACEYIQNNYASSSLSLESTADALSISSAHLSRLFKKHMGQNFSEYMLKIRMEHAKQLLETTSLPTTAIAAAIGYDNSAYFRTSFKAYFNMTPRQYRQITCGKD